MTTGGDRLSRQSELSVEGVEVALHGRGQAVVNYGDGLHPSRGNE